MWLLQVAKFIPRGVILQYLGAQREIYIETAAAASLARYMPSGAVTGQSRVVRSPMTGALVEVRRAAHEWGGEYIVSKGLQGPVSSMSGVGK